VTHLTVPEWGRVAVGEGGFTRGEANALLLAARRHPLGGRDGTDIVCDHHTFLRARQMVGVLAGPGCSLEILPKVDPAAPDEDAPSVRGRLVHMLDVALGLGLSTGQSAAMARRAESLLDVFIAAFADRLLAEARRGLPRQYRACEEDLRALRGRLDAVRQFTVNAVRPDRLACRFDSLEADGPLMQVMKATVLLVERYARAAETRRKLAELRFLLAEVSEVPRGALPWRAVRLDRTNRRWQSLLDLARLLLGASWQKTHAQSGAPEGITLLFPMNDLFERYIAVQLRRALAGSGVEVVAQGGLRYCLGPWRPGEDCIGDSHATKPDILIRKGGRVLTVIDTKWKHLTNGIAQGDVYQMMAYARLYRCDRLILLYPGLSSDVDTIVQPRALAQGPERLDAASISLDLGESELRLALSKLVAGVTEVAPQSFRAA
jgi:5-methylcytosine-specific restriction enzyme subunit McrC